MPLCIAWGAMWRWHVLIGVMASPGVGVGTLLRRCRKIVIIKWFHNSNIMEPLFMEHLIMEL